MAIDRNRRPKPGRHDVPLPADYRVLLTDVKSRIRAAQLRASLSVNQELIQLYWDIGRLIDSKPRVGVLPSSIGLPATPEGVPRVGRLFGKYFAHESVFPRLRVGFRNFGTGCARNPEVRSGQSR
jgi:hypothetical protein